MYENIKTVDSGGFTSCAFGFLKGMVIAVLLTVGVFAIFALLLSYTTIGENTIPYIAYCTEFAGAVVCGFISAKRAGTRGIITGAIAGFLYILIMWIVASLASDGFFVSPHILTMLALAVIAGAIGGILGVNLKSSANNKKKR
ncbi:MAG: TIGR04086 family membrane protein [Clostridia bacterium]|nr:TIGR04086 family membrane protein [Clostridia bacterium]